MFSKISNLFNKYYKLVVVVSFALVVIVGMRIISTSRKKDTAIDVKQPQEISKEKVATSIEGVTPGVSDKSKLEVFGEPRSEVINPDGSTLFKFGPEKSPVPIEVVVQENKIVFIKKYPSLNDKTTLKYYLDEYGNPDLSLFSEAPGFKAHVFLDEGLVVVAQEVGRGNVYELRYFVPTTKEEFLATWGKDLSSQPPTLPPLYY